MVTCRSELVAACPAANSLEIPTFTPQEGGQLLLNLANKARTATAADIKAAEELSELLGGLALAIDIIARQIFVKKKSMLQFLPYFKKNKQSLRMPPRYAAGNPYYSETLVTVWQTAFNSLDDNSSLLLGLFCFFAPDDIPREIINTLEPIPGTWEFLSDMTEFVFVCLCSNDITDQDDRYEDAEEQLLRMSLIKINDDTGMISLHRLTQEAYYYHLTDQKRHNTFHVAYRILCQAFPKRELRRQMYEVWGVCEALIHHVEIMQDKYEELRQKGFNVQDSDLDIMLADASWYV